MQLLRELKLRGLLRSVDAQTKPVNKLSTEKAQIKGENAATEQFPLTDSPTWVLLLAWPHHQGALASLVL